MKKIYSIFLFAALLVASTNVSAQADAATISNISVDNFFEVYTGTGPLGTDFTGQTIMLEQDSFITVSWTVSSNNDSNVERSFMVVKRADNSNIGDPRNDYESPGVSGVRVLSDYAHTIPASAPLGTGNFIRLGGKIYNAGVNENPDELPNFGQSGWISVVDVPFTTVESGTLSTSDKNAFQFALYPNPAKNRLNINTQETISNVSVIDMLGRVVLSANNVRDYLDISSLTNAMYIVKLTSDKGVSTKRFIKQ